MTVGVCRALAVRVLACRAFAPLCAVMLASMGSPAELQGQVTGTGDEGIVGTWNLETESLADRPTRGVRNTLLRITDGAQGLEAQVSNLRNQFVPVEGFVHEPDTGTLRFRYGAYAYALAVGSDGVLAGTLESPLGQQAVTGRRQDEGDHRFAGDDVPAFEATRPGVIGHITDFAPPDDEADPGAWVRSRIASPDEWALVVRDGVSVGFTNATDFEELLEAHAGRRVEMTAVWVGERMEIVRMAPLADPQ